MKQAIHKFVYMPLYHVYKAIERFCETPKDEPPKVTKIKVKFMGHRTSRHHIIVRHG